MSVNLQSSEQIDMQELHFADCNTRHVCCAVHDSLLVPWTIWQWGILCGQPGCMEKCLGQSDCIITTNFKTCIKL